MVQLDRARLGSEVVNKPTARPAVRGSDSSPLTVAHSHYPPICLICLVVRSLAPCTPAARYGFFTTSQSSRLGQWLVAARCRSVGWSR